MTKYALLIAAIALAAGSTHASIFDARTTAVIAGQALTAKTRSAAATEAPTLYYPVIVEIDDDSALQRLQQLGTIIWHRRDNMLLCSVPRQNLPQIEDIAEVSSASIGSRLTLSSDRSRQWSNVAPIYNGTATDKCGTLDGSGITVGLCDIGIDPNHIAFRKDGNSAAPSRVSLVTHYVDSTAQRLVADTPDKIAAWTTDTPDETHGTHVAAIMASAYTGNPYHGYAPAADIVATTSQLFDVALLCGIEDIIEHARQLGQPAVINLSISSLIGPRDGTDAVCRYIDRCAQDAIICFAAGNYGLSKYAIHHDFDTAKDTIGTILDNRVTWDGMNVSGYTDIWAKDDTPLSVRVVIYDFDTQDIVYRSPWFGGKDNTEGSVTLSAANAWLPTQYNADSHITIAWDTDRHNNRTHIAALSDMHSTTYRQGNPWSRYYFGYEIHPLRPTSIDIYADGSQTFLRSCGIPGMLEGTAEGAFNNMASPASVLAIGGYDNRATVPALDGTEITYSGINPGQPMPYTSYGNTLDGRHIPDFCAPSNTVISAMNRYYRQAHPEGYTVLAQTVDSDNNTHSWYDEGGTSMASPAVAGIIALWLQADPTITVEDIRDIVAHTARTDIPDQDNPRWGLGAIDAAAGLKYRLEHQSISDISVDATRAIPVATRYHDILGRPLDTQTATRSTRAIILRTDTYADGSQRTTKLLR